VKIRQFETLLDVKPFCGYTVNGADFFKAVKCVDAVNRTEKDHTIILSVHNGFLDLASCPNKDESGFYGEVCKADGMDGAVMVNRQFLDGLKTKGNLELAYLRYDGKLVLSVKGAIDAVIMPESIDKERFLEVMDYEYHEPVPVVKESALVGITAKPVKQAMVIVKPIDEPAAAAKPKKAPKRRASRQPILERNSKPNGAFVGWTSNRLGTKQVKICKW
jgi:hypothetical protein